MKTFPTRVARRVFAAITTTLVVSLVFWACQKKFAEPDLASSGARRGAMDDITVVDGTLRFSSEKVLAATLRVLYENQKPEQLTDWEAKRTDFRSMRRAFNEIFPADQETIGASGLTNQHSTFIKLIGDDGDREAVRVVADPVWATLLNHEGVLLVNNTAYRFLYDKVVRVDNFGTVQNVKRLIDNPASRKEFNIKRQRIVTTGERQTTKAGRLAVEYNNEVVCIQEYWHGGWLCCKKRFVGEIEATGTDENPFNQDIWYRVLETASKHQRRTSGIWWPDTVPELKLKFRADVSDPLHTAVWASAFFPEADPDGWLTLTDFHTLEKSQNGCFPGLPTCLIDFTIDSYWGQHQGKCDDNQWRSCNNTW